MSKKILAMIPGRMGSERLPVKNLALIDGRPMISYAVEAAVQSGVFDRVIVNSDGAPIGNVASQYGAEFYHRVSELGSSETKSDEVVYDFMKQHPSDYVAWVNPTSPLQTSEEVRNVVNYFIEQELDSLITVKNEPVHCVFEGKPLNFSQEGLFAKTQDLTPVQPFVYSVMMWRTSRFMEDYENQGHALFCGKLGYYTVSKKAAIIIKTDEDLMIAESILLASKHSNTYQVRYYEQTDIKS